MAEAFRVRNDNKGAVLVFQCNGDHRVLHLSIRRQRQVCIRNSLYVCERSRLATRQPRQPLFCLHYRREHVFPHSSVQCVLICRQFEHICTDCSAMTHNATTCYDYACIRFLPPPPSSQPTFTCNTLLPVTSRGLVLFSLNQPELPPTKTLLVLVGPFNYTKNK